MKAFLEQLKKVVTTTTIALIALYQKSVSPWLGPHCRFYPTCSEWARQAVETYGAFGGTWRALGRLLRCHPFHPGGYDPLEERGA